jgi:hypothetical protein
MGIDNDQLIDLVRTTLKALPDGQFEVAWDSQHFEFCNIYNKNRRTIDGGTSIQRNIVLDETGAAAYRRLYDTDQPSVENVQFQIDVPWTQLGTNYSWDVLEIMRNKASGKGYIDLMESRRLERLWGLAELIEERGWLTPTSATDNLYPYGVPYYLNKRTSGSTGAGFDGQTIRYGDGTTGTTAAGIDASVEAKWRNYAATYVSANNELLRTLRRAFLLTRFRPPANISNPPGSDNPGSFRKLYANADVNIELQDMADKRDDNSGATDLAGKALIDKEGTTYFNRVPLVYIPQLDSDTTDPIYYVDFDKFQPIVQDGYWMEESKPMMDRGQHTTVTVFLDAAHQNLCTNRRTAGFVVHKVTSA